MVNSNLIEWQTKLYKVEGQADNNDKGKLQAANKVQPASL